MPAALITGHRFRCLPIGRKYPLPQIGEPSANRRIGHGCNECAMGHAYCLAVDVDLFLHTERYVQVKVGAGCEGRRAPLIVPSPLAP